jgi:hypothetical protein
MKPLSAVYRYLAVFFGALMAGMLLMYLGGIYLFPVWLGHGDYAADIRNLHHEKERLRNDIEWLKHQYRNLHKRLDTYAPHDLRYSDVVDADQHMASMALLSVPPELSEERLDVQQVYHRLVLEKQRWDRFLQDKYKHVLGKAVEPVLIQPPYLVNEASAKYFDDLTASLRLHKKLIRDVRIFHSEIQFQQKYDEGDLTYKAYDYKLKLDPFARESSVADAMQQALSALSTGVYHQEAVEVLDRLGDEFTRPVREEYERLLSADGDLASSGYNYNIFLTFAKKIMDYTDMLANQSSIALAPKAFGELDYLHRRLQQSFHDLYEIGQQESIDAALLDMEELERNIQ